MRAIIVDDEEVARSAMQRRIKWDKYGITDVLAAQSMRQAIQLMEEKPVQLMLCDVEMPGGSGLELYEWVRTYSPDTECIFVSCHPEYEYVRKALTMGSMDYILKPVDYEEMDKILQNAVERINLRQAAAENNASGLPGRSEERKPAAENDRHDLSIPVKERKAADINTSDLPENDNAGENKNRSGRPWADSVLEAADYIMNNLASNMSIKDIADAVHLNPQYFMRLFKKETGKSVLEYITDCRLAKAKHMLRETNIPITEVSMDVGYDNFSYFSQLFKRNEGMSPSEYRKR